jgi:hypothetical protein
LQQTWRSLRSHHAAETWYLGQTVEREKVHRIIEERNLASLANNTRWASLFSNLLSHRVPARLKHVGWLEMSDWSAWLVPALNYLEVLSAGPVHFREIEWIDFDCGKSDVAQQACSAAARDAKLTSEVVGHVVRVLGYRCLA